MPAYAIRLLYFVSSDQLVQTYSIILCQLNAKINIRQSLPCLPPTDHLLI